jgi:DNA-3-methyladenine glycosylase
MASKVLVKEKYCVLPRSFYARDADVVARELLGKLLVRETTDGLMSAKIVETEAYFGDGKDPASHAFNGPTPRSSIMFGQAGLAYVYFNYGVHWLLNFIAKEEGKAGAVLIRAVQPVEGLELMLKNRSTLTSNLTNGPAKLTKALAIDGAGNGADVTKPKSNLYVAEFLTLDFKISRSTRIGINRGQDKKLRFFIKDNAFVSRR